MSERAGTSERASEWVYQGLWGVLAEWFRVPRDPPSLPAVSDEKPEAFRPARGFLRYLKFFFWIWLVVFDLVLTIGYVILAVFLLEQELPWLALALLPVALAVIVLPDIVAYVAVHLRYDTTWYVINNRSARIRRGAWTVYETTITFENVQNLDIHQGPVQRYFGIADLVMHTAGGGANKEEKQKGLAHEGRIEGIGRTTATQLRQQILERLRASGSAGLGDEPEEAKPDTPLTVKPGGWSSEHLMALRALREETRLLAGVVENRV